MLLLGGTDDAALVRSIVETNTWFSTVMGEELCFISSTLKEVSRHLSVGGEGVEQMGRDGGRIGSK